MIFSRFDRALFLFLSSVHRIQAILLQNANFLSLRIHWYGGTVSSSLMVLLQITIQEANLTFFFGFYFFSLVFILLAYFVVIFIYSGSLSLHTRRETYSEISRLGKPYGWKLFFFCENLTRNPLAGCGPLRKMSYMWGKKIRF